MFARASTPRPTVLMAHPQTELYGADRMFLESVTAMNDAGYDVVVTVPSDGDLVPELRRRSARVALCPTPVLRKSALSPRGLVALVATTAAAVPSTVRLLRQTRPDVVYVSTVTAPLWTIASRLMGLRVVAHVHEAEEVTPAVFRLGLSLPLLASQVVIVNSRATAEVICKTLPVLRRKVRLVYNGVCGPPEQAAPRQKLNGQIRLLVVGRLSPRKGSHLAIDAVAELRRRGADVALRFVGDVFTGYEWYAAQLRDAVDTQGLGEVVRFDGFVQDVWPVYAATDIALVPSLSDSFGNNAVEAQLAGVPVVVADRLGLPETVDGGRFGTLVRPDDSIAFADGVEGLLSDWPAAVARAERARAHASQEFSLDRYHQQVASIVDELRVSRSCARGRRSCARGRRRVLDRTLDG